MITEELYRSIAQKYGSVGSWAVWTNEGTTPRSNIGDLSVFDCQKNQTLLETLRTDIVMVGLNLSRRLEEGAPFRNFHDSSSRAHDYKLRRALHNTACQGAYMTDFIKGIEMTSSADLRRHLKENPETQEEQLSEFRKELDFIGSRKPILLAFGNMTYNLMTKLLNPEEYLKLVPLRHYSDYSTKTADYVQETRTKLKWAGL